MIVYALIYKTLAELLWNVAFMATAYYATLLFQHTFWSRSYNFALNDIAEHNGNMNDVTPFTVKVMDSDYAKGKKNE